MIKCNKCHLEKETSEFVKSKNTLSGFTYDCSACRRKIRNENRDKINKQKKDYYWKNRQQHLDEKRRDYLKHKDARIASSKEYYQENKDAVLKAHKEDYANNKEKFAAKAKDYRQRNSDVIKQKKREYYQQPDAKIKHRETNKAWKKNNPEKRREMDRRYINKDPIRKIIRNMRNRIFCVLKRSCATKANHTIDMLGCTPQFLKDHLESQFYNYTDETGQTIKMSWDNLGNGPGFWQVDHIIAFCLFNLENEEDQLIANHWTNLQPLWFHDHDLKNQSDLFLREEFKREGKTVSLVE